MFSKIKTQWVVSDYLATGSEDGEKVHIQEEIQTEEKRTEFCETVEL